MAMGNKKADLRKRIRGKRLKKISNDKSQPYQQRQAYQNKPRRISCRHPEGPCLKDHFIVLKASEFSGYCRNKGSSDHICKGRQYKQGHSQEAGQQEKKICGFSFLSSFSHFLLFRQIQLYLLFYLRHSFIYTHISFQYGYTCFQNRLFYRAAGKVGGFKASHHLFQSLLLFLIWPI